MESVDEISGSQHFSQLNVFIPWKTTASVHESWMDSFSECAWTKGFLGNKVLFWIPAFFSGSQ